MQGRQAPVCMFGALQPTPAPTANSDLEWGSCIPSSPCCCRRPSSLSTFCASKSAAATHSGVPGLMARKLRRRAAVVADRHAAGCAAAAAAVAPTGPLLPGCCCPCCCCPCPCCCCCCCCCASSTSSSLPMHELVSTPASCRNCFSWRTLQLPKGPEGAGAAWAAAAAEEDAAPVLASCCPSPVPPPPCKPAAGWPAPLRHTLRAAGGSCIPVVLKCPGCCSSFNRSPNIKRSGGLLHPPTVQRRPRQEMHKS